MALVWEQMWLWLSNDFAASCQSRLFLLQSFVNQEQRHKSKETSVARSWCLSASELACCNYRKPDCFPFWAFTNIKKQNKKTKLKLIILNAPECPRSLLWVHDHFKFTVVLLLISLLSPFPLCRFLRCRLFPLLALMLGQIYLLYW